MGMANNLSVEISRPIVLIIAQNMTIFRQTVAENLSKAALQILSRWMVLIHRQMAEISHLAFLSPAWSKGAGPTEAPCSEGL